jgi:putative Mg2+ transporter-C (MgtC) family protein
MNVRGLTTAASLWAAAAIGMAVGAGYYFGAAATTVVVILALFALRELRDRVLTRLRTDFGVLSVAFSDTGSEINAMRGVLDRHGLQIRSLGVELEDGRARFAIRLRIPPGSDVQSALEEILALFSVERVSITGLHEVE